MRCPQCGSENVTVQAVEKGQMTTKKGVGFGGRMNNLARSATALCTFGASNLFWKKNEGTNKTSTQNASFGICQDCGNMWEIKKSKVSKVAPKSIFR